MVERDLAKVDVAGSTPVSRSKSSQKSFGRLPQYPKNLGASLPGFGDEEMRHVGSGNMFGALIAELGCVDTFEKGFS